MTDTPIHAPSDSILLWDSMRILVGLMHAGQGLPGAPALVWCNRSRVAKKRARTIRYTPGADKKLRLYRDLVRVTEDTLESVRQAQLQLTLAGACAPAFEHWQAQLNLYSP